VNAPMGGPPGRRTRARKTLSVIAPLAVLAAGSATSYVLVRTAPEARPEPERRAMKIVHTVKVAPRRERIAVHAYGTVVPVREVVIRPEVRGRVIRQHAALAPGGFLEAGDELIRIDPSDYEHAVVERETQLAEAQYELDVERGRQVVASRELSLLEGDLPEEETNRSLVLREPHLRRAEALIRKAENQIELAKLQLSRTTITAPFNSMVLEESVEEGQLVEAGSPVATLVGTDEFWVQAAIPVDRLKWIRLPGYGREGASVKVLLETGDGTAVERQGRVARLLTDLEPSGRMARVLISVLDPLGLRDRDHDVPLLLGSYVRVEIDAGELDGVLSIPRTALREGDRIWVVGAANRLQIREATVLWARRESVLVADCIAPGEELVVSGLRVALPGMEVDPRTLPSTRSTEVTRSGREP